MIVHIRMELTLPKGKRWTDARKEEAIEQLEEWMRELTSIELDASEDDGLEVDTATHELWEVKGGA